jgi:hypothetical protein
MRMFHSTSPMPASLGKLFFAFGAGLLVLFSATVLTNALPLRLLDPEWQIRATRLLVGNASIALVGFALVHLAAASDERTAWIRTRRESFSRWAVLASLGFLLLIPLQAVAIWRTYQQTSAQMENQRLQVDRKLAELRQSISTAGSTAELQSRLDDLQAPPLTAAELARPLDDQQARLLERLDRSEIRLMDRLQGPSGLGIWSAGQESLRLVISSLAIGLAFAAGAWRPGASQTLLEDLVDLMRWKAGKTIHSPDGDYFHALSCDEVHETIPVADDQALS